MWVSQKRVRAPAVVEVRVGASVAVYGRRKHRPMGPERIVAIDEERLCSAAHPPLTARCEVLAEVWGNRAAVYPAHGCAATAVDHFHHR